VRVDEEISAGRGDPESFAVAEQGEGGCAIGAWPDVHGRALRRWHVGGRPPVDRPRESGAGVRRIARARRQGVKRESAVQRAPAELIGVQAKPRNDVLAGGASPAYQAARPLSGAAMQVTTGPPEAAGQYDRGPLRYARTPRSKVA